MARRATRNAQLFPTLNLSPIHYRGLLTGGGGGNFHYKGIYRCAAGMGYIFQASKYMNGYHFHLKSISMGYLFRSKSI